MEVDISGAVVAMLLVSREQTVKKEFELTYHQLPFTLTTLGIAMLVLFCVSETNYQTSGVSNLTQRAKGSILWTADGYDTRFPSFGEYAMHS
jgi:hypothetical protein